MKSKRIKHISRLLAAVLAVGCAVPVGTVSAATVSYGDVKGTAYEDAVSALSKEGVLNGYEDGTFKPENNITRAEVSKIFGVIIQNASLADGSADNGDTTTESAVSDTNNGSSKATDAAISDSGAVADTTASAINISDSAKMTAVADTMFNDLSGSSWAAPYIGISAACGIVNGYGNNSFIPGNNITYNELATMAVRAGKYDMTGNTAAWPKNYITAAQDMKLFKGMEDFSAETDGSQYASRGNTAVLINNALASIKTAAADGYDISAEAETAIDVPKMSISLDEAVEIMQTTGMNAETAALSKKSDQNIAKGYQQTASNISHSLDYASYMDLNTLYSLQQSGVTTTNLKITQLQRAFVEANIDNNYQADMNKIECTTRDLYYGMLQAQLNVEVSEASLAVQQETLRITQAKHENDTASDIELASQEYSVTSAEDTLSQAKQSLASAQRSFCMLMGISTDTVLTLTTPLEKVEAELPSLSDAVKSQEENNLTLKYYDYLVQLTEMQYNSLRYTTSTSSSTYKSAGIAYEQAQLAISQSQTNMKTTMTTDYNSIQDLENQIATFQSTIALTEKTLGIKQTQYNLGMTTLSDVQSTELSLQQAKQGLTSAIVKYNTAVSDLTFAMGVGTTRISFN